MKVYRRRRLVAAILALVLVALMVFGVVKVVGMLNKNDAGTSSTGPVATGSATAGATNAPSKAPAKVPEKQVCDEDGIKVSASSDKKSYAAGELPKLTLRVNNTGAVACPVNVGTSQMEFKVTSGNDIIFNSRDCQSDANDLVKSIKPAGGESANFTWKRNRSVAGCTKVVATPGPGTYVYTATLGKWSSERVVFTLK